MGKKSLKKGFDEETFGTLIMGLEIEHDALIMAQVTNVNFNPGTMSTTYDTPNIACFGTTWNLFPLLVSLIYDLSDKMDIEPKSLAQMILEMLDYGEE